MIDAREIRLASRKKTVVPINLSMRVTGLFYAVYGGIASLKLLQIALSGHGSPVNLLASAILGAFFFFGLVLSLSVESLTLDPAAREYEFRKGIWPFVRTDRGSAASIKAIAIDRIARTQVEDGFASNDSSATLKVKIEWKGDKSPLVLFSAPEESLLGSNRRRIEAKASRVAAALEIPLSNRS